MIGAYVTLEQAAELEDISYRGMQSRINRSPSSFKLRTEAARENGGKPRIMVAVSSLSTPARKVYRAAQKVDGRDVIIEQRAAATPWYVEADLNSYIDNHKKAFYEAVELANQIQDFVNYDGSDRTAYAERFALKLGVSAPTLYRYVQDVLEANAWALKLEKEDGQSRDYFRVLALCRKPKKKATFPSLTGEQKAVIENIWFDPDFANNQCTIEMLYEYFEKEADRRGWDGYPSVKTVARYIKHLMERRGAESARYLAANGLREWKNKKQLKGKRDATTLDVMEYVVADAHTFDLWVQYTAPNGKVKAARVTSQGINKFGTLYTDYELCHYADQKVGVKWDIDDVTKLYVYNKNGEKICEAVSAELLQFGDRVSQEALAELSRKKNRQLAQMRELHEDFITPYEQRVAEGRAPGVFGRLDLMIKADHGSKVVTLPQDKEFRSEMASRSTKKKTAAEDEFLGKKADDALSRLRAMNE